MIIFFSTRLQKKNYIADEVNLFSIQYNSLKFVLSVIHNFGGSLQLCLILLFEAKKDIRKVIRNLLLKIQIYVSIKGKD